LLISFLLLALGTFRRPRALRVGDWGFKVVVKQGTFVMDFLEHWELDRGILGLVWFVLCYKLMGCKGDA
jgi:hypothetical protein